MEDAQIVDILDVSLLEVEPEIVLLREEVNRIESLSLGFGNGRDVGGAREALEACEKATGILDDDLPVFAVEQGTELVGRVTTVP